MEPVTTAKALETAKKIYDTAKKIEKFVNMSREMKNVAGSEGKDKLKATFKFASNSTELAQNGLSKVSDAKAEKTSVSEKKSDELREHDSSANLTDNFGFLEDIPDLEQSDDEGVHKAKVDLFCLEMPSKTSETILNKDVFNKLIPEHSELDNNIEQLNPESTTKIVSSEQIGVNDIDSQISVGNDIEQLDSGSYKQSEVPFPQDENSEIKNDQDSPRQIKTINDLLEGQKHPETGVPYERKVVETDTGEKVEGVFPQFESEFDAQLPEDLEKATDKEQFEECKRQLKDKCDLDPEFRKTFTPDQLADIEDGFTPEGYTWHHNEQKGKMQLVNSETHWNTRHTGGRNIWGGGTENRRL